MKDGKVSNIIKRMYREAKKAGAVGSLKHFARNLLKSGNSVAENWFFNKSSKVNVVAKEARQKLKGARIAAEKSAKKSHKSK